MVRAASALLLILVALFCAYGILATFEPMEVGRQWTWRVIYSLGLLAASAGAICLLRGQRASDD